MALARDRRRSAGAGSGDDHGEGGLDDVGAALGGEPAQRAFEEVLLQNTQTGATVGPLGQGVAIDRQATDWRPQPLRQTDEPLDFTETTSADNRLAASSNEELVRVEDS